jgi:hypothetical protein
MSGNTPGEIVALSQAKRSLAEATTLDEIKLIRDKAEAVRKYAQSAALGLDAQNYAAEIKLRAERKAGELLSSLSLRGGDRKSNRHSARLKIRDLGISQAQSTRWQVQSKLPESEFEQYLSSARDSGREITSADIIRLARKTVAKHLHSSSHEGQHAVVDDASLGPAISGVAARISDGEKNIHGIEILYEIKNHRDLMDNILGPVCSGETAELSGAERRVLRRLLNEIGTLIQEFEHHFRLFLTAELGEAEPG